MSKLQDLADALAKSDPEVTIVDHVHYAGGAEPRRETTIMRGGTTVGMLTETSSGRFSFTAPEDAKFNVVAPIVSVLDEENIKIAPTE